MFSGNSILFFILFAAAVAVIIVFSSFFRRRISSAKRKIFYWIAAVVVTVIILIINIGTFGEMLTEQSDNEYIGYILEPPYTLEEMKCLASTGRLSDDDYYRTDDNTDYDYQEETSDQTEEIEDVSPKIYLATYITDIDEATDVLTKVSPINVVASGQLKQHNPQNTMDGDPETNWQVTVEKGTDTDAINEYIGFRFKEKQKIDYIVLTNGTPVPNDLYKKNGRVKSFRFTEKNPKSDETDTDAFESSSFELESDSKKVIFYCEHLEVSELFLMIDKIWPGSKYDEFGIADIQFYEGSWFRFYQDKKAS